MYTDFSGLKSQDDSLERQALRHKFIYAMTGLFLGLASIVGGMILFLHGVTGSTSWTARVLGNESTITDAAPGAVLFVVGLFLVIVTRYRVKINSSPTQHNFDLRKRLGRW